MLRWEIVQPPHAGEKAYLWCRDRDLKIIRKEPLGFVITGVAGMKEQVWPTIQAAKDAAEELFSGGHGAYVAPEQRVKTWFPKAWENKKMKAQELIDSIDAEIKPSHKEFPAVFVAAYNLGWGDDYTGLFITAPDGIQLVGYGSEQQLVPTTVFYPFYAVANGRQSVTAQTKIIISDIREKVTG